MVPNIPGYYYDETRRRYFRVTNGDQRHNSAYSNNAVQQQGRREAYRKTKRPRRDVQRPKPYPDFMALALSRAGYFPLITKCVLSGYSSVRHLAPCRVWPGPTDRHIFATHGNLIDLMLADVFARDPNLPPQCILSFPMNFNIEPMNYPFPSVLNLSVHPAFLFAYHEDVFNLWQFSENLLRVTDVTHRLDDTIKRSPHPDIHEMFNTPVLGAISDNSLHLISYAAFILEISLPDLKLVSFDRVFSLQQPVFDERSKLKFCGDIWCYNTGNYLTLRDTKARKTVCWKFDSLVQDFFMDEVNSVYKRVFVVTQKSVVTRLFTHDLSRVRHDSKHAIHNDNQAYPLVQKIGPHLIVEESKDTFKVFDMRSVMTETLHIEGAPSNRGSMPQIVAVKDSLFWTSENETSLFASKSLVSLD